MKVRKFNENSNIEEPEIGDYVICNDITLKNNKNNDYSDFHNFISSSIGMCFNINHISSNDFHYEIKYYNIPIILNGFFNSNYTINMKREEILYWNKDKSKL